MKLTVLTVALALTLGLLTACDRGQVKITAQADSKPPAAAPTNKDEPKPAAAPAAAKDESKPVTPPPSSNDEVAVIEFWPDVAPGHVDNFKKLAKQGFYDGTAFHRVIKDFMIQGGDPLTKDAAAEARWGTGGPGYTIKAEFNERSHTRGVLSMARSNDPDSAGSQFFICHGNPTFLDRKYTAFGKLIKGDEVLEKIATTPTRPPDRPVTRLGVESVKIVARSSLK
jgi:peptidyl-prolyl cis-trans isomerase B (cyclophilin B)